MKPMTLDQRAIQEHISEAFKTLVCWLNSMPFKTLLCAGLSTCAISSAQAQQHDTLPRQNSPAQAQTTPIEPVQVRTWLEQLNGAQASDLSTGHPETTNTFHDQQISVTQSLWIPAGFFILVLICGGLTATRMPMVWKRGIAYHRPEQRAVTLGAKIDAGVGCFFAMIVGTLSAPLLLASAVDLAVWAVRALLAS